MRGLAIVFCLLLANALQAQIEQPGVLAILGYSDQTLVFSAPPEDPIELGPLGTTANLIRKFDDQVFVVHSGDYSTGEGAELWYTDNSEILDAAASERDVQWTVLPLPTGSNPWDVYVDGNTAWISYTAVDQVGVWDLESGHLLATVPNPGNPQGLAANDTLVALMNAGFGYGSTVTLFSKINYNLIGTIDVGPNPQYAVFDEQGFLHVLCSGRSWDNPPTPGSAWKVNLSDFSTESLPLSGNPGEISWLAGSEEIEPKVILGDEWASGTPHVSAYHPATLIPDESALLPDWGGNAICCGDGQIYLASASDNRVHVYSHDWSSYTYYYTLDAPVIDLLYFEPDEVEVDEPGEVPMEYALLRAWPNPFNSSIQIRYRVPGAGAVQLELYDLQGRLVTTLRSGNSDPGQYLLTCKASGLSSGTYFLRLKTENEMQTQRLLYLR